jgi:hypothetical protein
MGRFLEQTSTSQKSNPIILFNNSEKTGQSKIEKQIRENKDWGSHCLTPSLKKWGILKKPSDGRNFVWDSKAPHSRQAEYNINEVVTSFLERINAK